MRPGNRFVFSLCRYFSAAFFLCALAAVAVLLLTDSLHRFQVPITHQHLAAFPLLFIGLSYICLQCSQKRRAVELCKGLLLGLAFFLWGIEMLMPASRYAALMDSAVVTIFVVDLSFIIAGHLHRRDHETP